MSTIGVLGSRLIPLSLSVMTHASIWPLGEAHQIDPSGANHTMAPFAKLCKVVCLPDVLDRRKKDLEKKEFHVRAMK